MAAKKTVSKKVSVPKAKSAKAVKAEESAPAQQFSPELLAQAQKLLDQQNAAANGTVPTEPTAPVAPVVPEQPVIQEAPVVPYVPPIVQTKSQRELEQSRKTHAIINKHTVLDNEGRKMFLKEDEVYTEHSMSPEEVHKFLGGKDPNLYFRKGECHIFMRKVLGDLLDEERDEYFAFREVIKNPDFLLFKHKLHNQYFILVPKEYGEHELDVNGDYVNKYVHQDYRVIAFTGQMNVPASFEPFFFKQKVNFIKQQIIKVVTPKGMSLI